jgi:hypothetical protein
LEALSLPCEVEIEDGVGGDDLAVIARKAHGK